MNIRRSVLHSLVLFPILYCLAANAEKDDCPSLLEIGELAPQFRSASSIHTIDSQVFELNLRTDSQFFFSDRIWNRDGTSFREIRYNQGLNVFLYREGKRPVFIERLAEDRGATLKTPGDPDLRPAQNFQRVGHEVRPENYDYNSGRVILSDVYTFEIQLPGKVHRLELAVPQGHSLENVANAVLASITQLPALHLDSISKIRINPRPSSLVATHSMMTTKSIIDVFPECFKEFLGRTPKALHLMRHEYGHTIAFKLWGRLAPPSEYFQNAHSDGVSISEYGDVSSIEDFGEGMAVYLNTQAGLTNSHARILYPSRFAMNDRIFKPGWREWAKEMAAKDSRAY